MIIKSHIRGGFRDAAAYLKSQGQNEVIRLVEISDPQAKNLDEAFRAMWAVADGTKVKKALHHISINPMKHERLTNDQVRRICERLENRYGYAHGDHPRVIVEHIKDGRQHFHVIWNRVSLSTGKPHWPYMHKNQSKLAAQEMTVELGLTQIVSRKAKTAYLKSSFTRTHIESSYAGLLGELPQPNRKKKGGKGDGAGGGMGSILSALKTTPQKSVSQPIKDNTRYVGKGNGPERRHKKLWVAVEKRQQGPK